MPTQEQTSVRLFKKDLGIGDTSTPRAFFEEPFASGALVKPSQILSQFNEVPGTAPIGMVHDEIIGVIQRKIDVVLTAVPGTTNSFQHDDLKDVVPFNHADGTYNYVIKDNLDNPIQFGQGDWVIDTVAGILIFYGAVPANMPPKISFYKYVGEKGTGSQTYYIVPDLTTRNNIPPSQRRDGTMCYVQADTDTYQLQGGIDNINWVNITKQIGLPENEVLANNSAGSFIIVNWSAKWSFVMYFRADRGASAFESGQIRIDYNDGQAYYEATGGRLENLGLTFDINVNGANLEFDWTTTDNVDDIALTYNIGNLAYVDGGGAVGDMLASVYDPINIAGDAFDMDNMVDGATNRLYDSTEKSKLAGIEAGAQVNPDAATIKTLYESNADTNAYDDAAVAKLAGIETGAQVNPTASAIKISYESNADTNAYDDAAVAKLAGIEAGAQVNPTASAIKTLYESNADTNAYTDAEAAKLAGLESSKFLGQYVSLVALETAHPDPGGAGYYGDVNPGVGQDVQRYIWDVDDSKYVAGAGPSGYTTPAEVKAAYESNANTNAYTDTDQSKLAGIEAGAQVNPTASAIKVSYESNADTNAYTDAEAAKLAGIEAGAQVNPTASAIKISYESNADTNAYTDAEAAKLAGIEAGAQVNPDAATIKTLYESNADTNAYDDAAVAKLSDLPDGEWLHNSNSSARLWGGIITDNGNGTVAIAAGEGLIKAQEAGAEDVPSTINQGQGSLLSVVSWTAVASLALVNEAYNFIFYDGNTGTIQATTDFYSISFTRDFTLGRAYRSGTDIVVRLCGTNLWNFNRRVQLFGEEVFPVIRASGMVVGDEGTRHFSLTAGVLWAELVNRFSTAAFNSTAADTYIAWYNDGAWQQQTGQSQINNTQYNNYGVGLVNLSNNQYGVHWVYMVHDSTVHVVYGRDSYTLSEADAAQPPAELPGLLLSYATLVAKITIGRNDTELTSAESAFALQFNSSAIIPHDELSGLNVGDYQHLTSAQKTALTTGVNADAQHIHGVEAVVYSTTHSHVNTVQDLINHMWSIGACQDGFDITDNTDGTVDLTAGSVVLRSTNTYHGELNGYAVSAVSNLTLINNATNFVMADYNSGTPIITSSSNWNDVFSDNTKALIYVVNRLNNQLNIIDFRGNNVDFITRNNVKTYKTKRVEHASGAMISDEGSLEFAITASEFYILNKSIIVPAFDTSGTDTFEYVYRDGAGGWTRVASQTAINGLYYDDNSGTLALVINHEFGIHWVYAVLNEPTNFKIVYGQDSYATLAEAQAAQALSSLPSNLDALSTAVLIGKIIIEEDAPTVFADIQSPFVDILQSANANTHNNLAGLNVGDYQHLTAAEKTKFDNLQLPMVRYQADQFLNVSSTVADYAVNAGAIVNLDDNDNGLLIREFDDTTEEGVGFVETIPEGVTNIIIELKSRAKTAPGAAAAVVPTIYVRDIPDNAVVGAWDAGTDLTAIALPTNEYFQYDTQTIALTTLGLSAGDVFQFELTRNTGSASDTLSGDWCLLEMILKFE